MAIEQRNEFARTVGRGVLIEHARPRAFRDLIKLRIAAIERCNRIFGSSGGDDFRPRLEESVQSRPLVRQKGRAAQRRLEQAPRWAPTHRSHVLPRDVQRQPGR